MTTKKKPSDYLKEGWCQGHYAENRCYQSVLSYSTEARKWCFLGAVRAYCNLVPNFALGNNTSVDYLMMARTILREKGDEALLGLWNDLNIRTQEQVIDLALEVEKRLENV